MNPSRYHGGKQKSGQVNGLAGAQTRCVCWGGGGGGGEPANEKTPRLYQYPGIQFSLPCTLCENA